MGFTRGAWTAGATLPGGDMANADFAQFLATARREHPWVPEAVLYRWARAYGTRLAAIIGSGSRLGDLGRDLGGGLYEAEIRYLADNEWAQTADGVRWRRSRLGLHVGRDTVVRLEEMLGGAMAPAPAEAAHP